MDALEDIVSAISDILVVFEEAQSNLTTDIVIDPKNMQVLSNEIIKMVSYNIEQAKCIADQKLRARMEETNVNIANAAAGLEKLINNQKKQGVIERSSYDALHSELKIILQNLVQQIQLTDFVNVGAMLDYCKRSVDCIVRMCNASSPENGAVNPQAALNAISVIVREQTKVTQEIQVFLDARIAETTDQHLKGRLKAASDVVRSGGSIVVSACQKAIQSPSQPNLDQRDKVATAYLEAVQEIVDVALLSSKFISNYALLFPMPPLALQDKFKALDDALEDALKKFPRVNQALARLETAVRKGDVKEVDVASKAFAEEVKKQVSQGRAVAQTKKDPASQAELSKLCDELELITPKVVKAAKEAASNKGDAKAMQNFEDLAEEVRGINSRLETAKRPEGDLIRGDKQIEESLKRLAYSVANKNVPEAVQAVKKVIDDLKNQIALGRAYAENVKDPEIKKAMLEACDRLEKLLPLLAQATKEALANPSDQAAQKRLAELIAKAKEESATIARLALEDQLAQNRQALEASLDGLYDAARRGDTKKSAELISNIADAINKRIELGRALAAATKDPVVRDQILKACDELERLMPELVAATKAVLENPNDEKALKHLRDVINQVKQASDRITTKNLSPASKVTAKATMSQSRPSEGKNLVAEEAIIVGGNLNSEIDRLRAAVARGDAKEANQAVAEITKWLKKQAELGRKLAEQTNDPVLKKKLNDAANKLDSLVNPIAQATREALANPNSKEAKQKLDKLLDEAKASNKVIVDAAESMKHIPYEEKPKDEIMAAAYAVKQATKAAGPPPIPEQKSLLDIASNIAKEMELLSIAAKQGSKKDMIACARRIAEMIQKIQQFSSEIANKCKDPILKQQLLNVSRVPKNFAVQLKIISAVKAASSEDDPTAAAQLVTCAQGLANSVVSTVKAAEAASLKCPK